MVFVEILLALILGIFSGCITGLIPGIHVNLISVLIISLSPLLLTITSPIVLAVFIISLAITHTFLDSIPSIYLGAPDEAQALNVLPGHRLLNKGEGHNAIVYTVIGSLGCLILAIVLFPIFIVSMEKIYPLVKTYIGYILSLIMIIMISKDKGKRMKSLVAFLLAGCIGLIIFSIPNLKQPLFPLLSGLFGFSILLFSLMQKSIIPQQDLTKPLTITKKNIVKSVTAASGVGFIAAFLPGFGSSQAAIVATNVVGDVGDEGFLSLVGGINTANMLISVATAYVLDKARNGAILTVNKLLGKIGFQEMLIFLAVALVVGGIASILALMLSKAFSKLIVKVNYNKIVLSIIIFITLLTFYFDGFIGLTILATSTAIGLAASYWGVGKNHLMGCLILPVILYFVL
ncbi:MAG: tripartite tricarboxylate transporter permease [Nanoarchaeota archaeon]|nr:tripartite tricarboxylate transporter permease [Nanoarchaeota archaeon]MBU1632105.1 tripartite tricarboxylate transporter permease [Nanoarchaeota archaeon]MBU1875739.1 tripartite tricarboxylate transporter permease [Nanoarchaeota archaeon]